MRRRRRKVLNHPIWTVLLWSILVTLAIYEVARNVQQTPTAKCMDGHLSYSLNRSGTCSWHGGVKEWNPHL